MTNQIIRRNKK